MLLPEKKEREYRFRLALRIGLPIFGLILVLVFTTVSSSCENLSVTFYVESLLLLLVSVYFILYLIYKGFDVAITDPVTKTFTREYLYEFLKKEIEKHKEYTLILVSVDNLTDINEQYGIKNGDKVLRFVTRWLGEYFAKEGLSDFPLGRIKGGDFLVGLEGSASEHKVLIDLLCLKSDELYVDNIEVKISGAITDTAFSKSIDHLFDHLYEQQEINRYKKETNTESIDPSELESLVVEAIENRSIAMASQTVFDSAGESRFCELFVRLKTREGKYIHQKKYKKVINKLGLTLDFDMMLVENVLANREKFPTEGVALEIATSSLRNPLFLERVKELFLNLDKKIEKRLIFIFSENEYYFKTKKFNTILDSYKKIGIRFAIDHLGVLHTSFLYLRDLNIDIVRFDGAYMKEDRLEESAKVVRGLGYIAHQKGVEIWLKMIETKSQYEFAKEMKADYFQGKYLSQVKEIE